MVRWLVRFLALVLSAGYFWSAWTIHAANNSFKIAARSEALAKVEGITELSALERGLSLPLLQNSSHKATISFRSGKFGNVVANARVPESVVESVLSQRPVLVEYVSNNPVQYRFRGTEASPVRPVLVGICVLAAAALLTLRRSNH